MGGSIAVTARRANGEVIRMCRWTNPLPFFFQNARLFEGDETHLDEYLKQWYQMRDDFERNNTRPEPDIEEDAEAWDKWSARFEYPMTPVYAPYPFLAPHGYGLVVIDYQTQTMLSMQGYSALIEVSPDTFGHAGPFPENPPDFGPLTSFLAVSRQEHEEEVSRISGLFKRKCLYVVPRGAESSDQATLVPDLDTARAIAAEDNAWFKYRFFVKPDPWKVRRFPETPDGADEFHDNLVDLGFQFTPQENDLWGAFRRQWEDA